LICGGCADVEYDRAAGEGVLLVGLVFAEVFDAGHGGGEGGVLSDQ
jgi:hypothetical protein